MQLDKALNLVVPVERDDGTTIYVHSTPVSREVFDRFFLVMAKTFSSLYTEGLGIAAGPRVAAKLLKSVASNMGEQQLANVQQGLIAEIRRLSNVIVPNETGGWTPMPLDVAISHNLIDRDDADEVENAVTFFTLASAMHKKREARVILAEAAKLWGAEITSQSFTTFAASLPTSTSVASTGEKLPPSSIPSYAGCRRRASPTL